MKFCRNSSLSKCERQQGNDEGWKMTQHKRTNNKHCKSKKRNRFQTDLVVSSLLAGYMLVGNNQNGIT